MPTLSPSDWLDILDDIRDQKVVLLIDPAITTSSSGRPTERYPRD